MPSGNSCGNPFLSAPIGRLFVANAVPTMLVMVMSGMLNVVDAMFLGYFVGSEALTAVSLVFPGVMILVALATLVGGGMSSLLARHLGARETTVGAAVFAQAHGLALIVALFLMASYAFVGPVIIEQLAGSAGSVAGMAQSYLLIMICGSPLQLLLAVHADAWRSEGRMGLVALLSVLVTLANVAFNYALIAVHDLGVAGSAWGTVLAQGLGLALLVWLRARTRGVLPLSSLLRHGWTAGWTSILSLGAPLSLGYLGIAVVAGALTTALRATAGPDYAEIVAGHGIVTRLLGLTYLPLMAMALTTQSIVGNNFGAGLDKRANAALRLALGVSFIYCGIVQIVFQGIGGQIGMSFTDDPAVARQVTTILRVMLAIYVFTGPVLVFAFYFQAIGQPGRSAVLTLTKPFVLSPALILIFAFFGGNKSVWFAFPLADILMTVVAAAMLPLILRDKERRGEQMRRGLA